MSTSPLPAILGGEPFFERPYHLVRPIMPPLQELMAGIEGIYETKMFTNQGPMVRSLEEKIAQRLNVNHCMLFCNGTMATMCLIKALGLTGEILVPSFTFAATTQAILWLGLQPRFVDIEPDHLTMDPKKTEEAITKDTQAIFPVNIFGSCCHYEQFQALANSHKLPLFYDSAQAFGSKYKNQPVGSFGDAEVLSFHATKIFHTGEGGAVVTNNTDLARKLGTIRNFGFSDYLNCTTVGINGKMDEFSALIGLKLLDRLSAHILKRKWVFQHYRDSLKPIPGIRFPQESPEIDLNYSYFYIWIDPEQFGLTNLELNYALIAEKIITRCYFYPPVHRTSYYQRLYKNTLPELPQTDWAATHTLCLPVYSDMQAGELAMIIAAIIRCQQHAKAIKEKLEEQVPSNWEAHTNSVFIDPHDRFILSNNEIP